MTCRLRFYVVLALAVMFAAAIGDAHAQERAKPTIEAVALAFEHRSNIMRGPPLFANVDGHEPTEDFIGSGATIVWPKWEVDLLHGRVARDCNIRKGCASEMGTKLSVRFYAWRRR